ncbi:MAG: hypothetical protein ACK5AZ_25715 [Bryobacteraceae bacterium]
MEAKDDGSFEIEDVPPGRYVVDVSGLPESERVSVVRTTDRASRNRIVELASGAPSRITVAVSKDAAIISGVARTTAGLPAAGMIVVLAPTSDSMEGAASAFRSVSTGPEGEFRFGSVAPGTYRVWAWEEVDLDFAADPRFREQFESELVSVGERSHVRVELKAAPVSVVRRVETSLR